MKNIHLTFKTICFAIIFGSVGLIFNFPSFARAETDNEQMCIAKLAGEPDEPQPKSCGEQGKDNRPNSCASLIGGVWVMQHSKCTPNGNGTFTYTHCDGQSTMLIDTSPTGTHLCCSTGTKCREARYVAACLD